MQPPARGSATQLKKILFVLDFRTPPDKIVPWAVSLARQFQATICVVAIAPDMTAFSTFFPPHARFQEKVSQKTEKQLKSFMANYFSEVPEVEGRVLVGREDDQILAAARQEGVDLIIMGTYARTGLDRLLWGSVSEKVVKGAPCPVFIIGPG